MNPAEPADGSCIYQLRIVLRDISPLIWRRVRVRSGICIAELHAESTKKWGVSSQVGRFGYKLMK